MAIDSNAITERTQAIVDAMDCGLSRREAARKLGISANTITGECYRYHLHMGKTIILDLARRFMDATEEEIAAACGRDMAPQILREAGFERASKGYSEARVKAMRAFLLQKAA